jgi:hypothetical protein
VFNKIGDVEKATQQKRNAAREIFNVFALLSRQLRNLASIAGKPLIGFVLRGMNIVWNNVKVSAYLAHPSKYSENRNSTLLPISFSIGGFVS